MKFSWEFNLMKGKNPQHTAAFLNGYDERNFESEEIAARESGQNSVDAGRDIDQKTTELVFQEISLNKEKKDEFLKLINFDLSMRPRVNDFGNEKIEFKKSLDSVFGDDDMKLLLIRDYGTCGLGGNWQEYEREDHFGRLVLALNLDDKARGDSNSGGSFGLGKTAYAKSSQVNTVFYHSVFKGTERSNGANRRLMGTGIYPSHNHENKKYGGFAYIGESIGENEVKPFENKAAEDLWDQINSLCSTDISRKSNEYGTDILILMSSLNLGKIRESIENYYFPAILQKKLTVRFIDNSGEQFFPNIRDREDLDQFVRLYEQAVNGKEIKEKELQVEGLRRYKNKRLGEFAIQRAEPDEEKSKRNNCLAIMRGTGMVINYLKVGGDQYESAVGVFIADKDIYEYLIPSENAAHSEWAENSSRLFGDFGDLGKDIVKKVNSNIKTRFRNFQKDLQPEVSYQRGDSGLLSKLLAQSLKGQKSSGKLPPEKKFNNPIALSLTKQARDEDVSKWRLKVATNEFTPESGSFDLQLLPSISLVGDSKKVPIKHMGFDITGDIEILNDAKPIIDIDYHYGDSIELFISFPNPGRLNYVVECKCIAQGEVLDV
jgi:hypothetical protein